MKYSDLPFSKFHVAAAAVTAVTFSGVYFLQSDAGRVWVDAHENTPSATAMKLGSFVEYTGTPAALSTNDARTRASAVTVKETLRANKFFLDNAMRACEYNAPACDPHVAQYAEMLKGVEKIEAPLEKIAAVSAWVNTAIRYDYDEADNQRLHRSMVGALIDGRGVCDEQAQLKLYALDRLKFAADDIRYIAEHVYVDGKQARNDHAVVAVRMDMHTLGHTVWVLNNNQADKQNVFIADRMEARGVVSANSQIEDVRAHLNYEGKSSWNFGGTFAVDGKPAKNYAVPFASANFTSSTIIQSGVDFAVPVLPATQRYQIDGIASLDMLADTLPMPVRAMALQPVEKPATAAARPVSVTGQRRYDISGLTLGDR